MSYNHKQGYIEFEEANYGKENCKKNKTGGKKNYS